MRAVVTDIREARREHGSVVWQIAVEPQVFSPRGGGTVIARAASGAELRVAVERVVCGIDGLVWLETRKPLMAGTAVECVPE